ncbi:helix-turn-helix domain-containing protein [bacterium]|nr:helix-turn-helix domain-containing protein [bacterium]
MSERRLGEILRERRESLNLSIEEVAKVTKLKKSTILALENGNYKELQEPIYIRGFLKIYASVLDLDYNKLSPILDRELRLAGKLEEEEEKNNRRLKLFFLITGIVITIAVFVFILVFYRNPVSLIIRQETQSSKVEVPQQVKESTKEVKPLEKLVLEESQPKEEKITVTETPSQVIQKEKEVSVEIKGLGYSWLRVIVDGNKVFEGFLNSGDFYSWKGKEKIVVRTGNAGGISITVNGKNLGILGRKGEVLEREFLPE